MREVNGRLSRSADGTCAYLHTLSPTDTPRELPPVIRTATIDAAAIHARCRADITVAAISRLARRLGLPPESLSALEIGYSYSHSAYTFPMRDGRGRVIGLRTRDHEGRKRAIRGSRSGLFLPRGLAAGPMLVIVEGPTDAAAAVSLGLPVVGRPDCRGGSRHLLDLLRDWRGAHVVIVADRDTPGVEGARLLARDLRANNVPARILVPPEKNKDFRDWVLDAQKQTDIVSVIRSFAKREVPPVPSGSALRRIGTGLALRP